MTTLAAGLPPLPPERPFVVPEVDTFTLANGLEVQTVTVPGLPLVTLRLVIRGGRADDGRVAGFTELLADALEEGTTSRSAVQLFDLLQDAGGDLNADAATDATIVAAHGLASSLPLLAELLADVVRNADFPRDGVRRVKALSLEDLETDESEPGFLASRAFARAVYGSHPYGTVAPTRSSIRAVTQGRLRAELPRRLRPERALLVVAGAVHPKEVRQAVEPFAGWEGAGAAPGPPPEAPGTGRRSIVVLDRPGSVQATLVVGNVGTRRTDAAAWPLDLAVTIYGGAFSSRLVQNLRVEKGYTYSPGAASTWLLGRGVVRTWASVRTEVVGPALAEIFREMERMGGEEVGAEELRRARRRESGLHLLSLQTAEGLARELGELWLSGLGPASLGEGVKAFARVTASEVLEASRRFLDPSRTVVVAVGDARKLGKALSSFGAVVRPRRAVTARSGPPAPGWRIPRGRFHSYKGER
jgi:zinc protease